MKIAIFTDSFYPQVNGVVTSILNSSGLLAENGHRIMIFTVKSNKKPKLHNNIVVKYFPSIPLITYTDYKISSPNFLITLHYLKRFNPDLIHIHTPFSMGINGILASKYLKLPLIGTYHTYIPEFLKYLPIPYVRQKNITKKFAKVYSRKIYNKCNLVLTPSLAMKKELIKTGVTKPISVLSNGIALDKFSCHAPLSEDSFNMVHFGRISFEKNIDIILDAFKIVLENLPYCKLTIVGKGPALKSLIQKAKSLQLNNKIHFTGYVSEDKLHNILCSSDLFVTASPIETQGLVILEAMAVGLPVIGPNSLAIPEAIKHGKNGFVFQNHNVSQFAEQILSILENQNLKKTFGENSRKYVSKYDLKLVVKKLEEIYHSITKGDI